MSGRRGIVAAFLLALLLALGFAGHAVWTVLVVAREPAPVEAWMTPGLIAKSYGITPKDLAAILNLGPDEVEGRTLDEIAAAEGMPVTALVAALEREIPSRDAAK